MDIFGCSSQWVRCNFYRLLVARHQGSEVTDWGGAELPGYFGRTAGQDLQEMLVLLLVDLATGEPLCRDPLRRRLSR